MSQKEMEELFGTFGSDEPANGAPAPSPVQPQEPPPFVPFSPLPPPSSVPLPAPASSSQGQTAPAQGNGSSAEPARSDRPRVVISNIRRVTPAPPEPAHPAPAPTVQPAAEPPVPAPQTRRDDRDSIEEWTIRGGSSGTGQSAGTGNSTAAPQRRRFNAPRLRQVLERLGTLPWLDIICIGLTVAAVLYVAFNFEAVTDSIFAVLLPLLTHLTVILIVIAALYLIYRRIRRRFF